MFSTPVESTVLAAIAYDTPHQLLWLEFRNRAVYRYCWCPTASARSPPGGDLQRSLLQPKYTRTLSLRKTAGRRASAVLPCGAKGLLAYSYISAHNSFTPSFFQCAAPRWPSSPRKCPNSSDRISDAVTG